MTILRKPPMTTPHSRQRAVLTLLLAAFAWASVVQATLATQDSSSPVQIARPKPFEPAPFVGSAARA